MIPKVIHYCWFGHNPLPPLAIKCIESWKKYLPDYEIKEWNEDNFDVNIIPYTAEAYQAKKYAFVSDYARFWILYNYGGLYFDTDVEVIRPMDDIIECGPFMGCEMDAQPGMKTISVAPGLGLGVAPGLGLYKKILDYYCPLHFDPMNITITIVGHTTQVLRDMGLQDEKGIQQVAGVWIYPSEYFNPTNIVTRRLYISENTRTIHHYAASWMTPTWQKRLKNSLRKFFPESVLLWYNRLSHIK